VRLLVNRHVELILVLVRDDGGLDLQHARHQIEPAETGGGPWDGRAGFIRADTVTPSTSPENTRV
jgi:hypothetical protein